jgi:hypothetical protein
MSTREAGCLGAGVSRLQLREALQQGLSLPSGLMKGEGTSQEV